MTLKDDNKNTVEDELVVATGVEDHTAQVVDDDEVEIDEDELEIDEDELEIDDDELEIFDDEEEEEEPFDEKLLLDTAEDDHAPQIVDGLLDAETGATGVEADTQEEDDEYALDDGVNVVVTVIYSRIYDVMISVSATGVEAEDQTPHVVDEAEDESELELDIEDELELELELDRIELEELELETGDEEADEVDEDQTPQVAFDEVTGVVDDEEEDIVLVVQTLELGDEVLDIEEEDVVALAHSPHCIDEEDDVATAATGVARVDSVE